MLPEKRKKIIISIIAIIIFIIVVIAIGYLSKYIKSLHEVKMREDDKYPSIYEYYGILKDTDNVYNLYGLNEEEKNLNLHTFYSILDVYVKGQKIVLYSDAVNEVRYENSSESFYFYELDSYYSNSYKVKLSEDYLLRTNGYNLDYWTYDKTEKTSISTNLIDDNILTNNNLVYYNIKDGIYSYNLKTKENTLIIPSNYYSKLKLLKCNSNYLIYLEDNDLYVYDLNNNKNINLSETLGIDESNFLDLTLDGILILKEDTLSKYLVKTEEEKPINTEELNDYQIKKCERISDDLYHFTVMDSDAKLKSIIFSLENQKIVKEYTNNYLYIMKVN